MKRPRHHKPHHDRKKRRPINVLASALTTFSLYLGISSIFLSIREQYDKAAYLILAAIICDSLDGTVARMTHSISDFGKELDSLADLVSFGVAPAVLIYCSYWLDGQVAGSFTCRIGSVIAIIFAICAALRLARFNVFQSKNRETFTGLPSPAAGGSIAAFVLFVNYFELDFASKFYILAPLTAGLAYLMVSTVQYPKDRLKKLFVRGPRQAFQMLLVVAVIIVIFHYASEKGSPAIVLFPLAMTYVLFGIGNTLVWKLSRKQTSPAESETQPELPAEPSPSEPWNNADRL